MADSGVKGPDQAAEAEPSRQESHQARAGVSRSLRAPPPLLRGSPPIAGPRRGPLSPQQGREPPPLIDDAPNCSSNTAPAPAVMATSAPNRKKVIAASIPAPTTVPTYVAATLRVETGMSGYLPCAPRAAMRAIERGAFGVEPRGAVGAKARNTGERGTRDCATAESRGGNRTSA